LQRLLLFFLIFLVSCGGASKTGSVRVAFLDAFEDETLAQAKKGFFIALKEEGYTPDKNMDVLYRNAQNDIPVLTQCVQYFASQNVDLIATNATDSTIAAVQNAPNIPVCMMVSPSPELAGLTDRSGKAPENLFGVYETLEYIDTAIAMIRQIFPDAKRIGTLINQSEPQSVDALARIRKDAAKLGMEIISLPANSGSETQMLTENLLQQNIDVFFALPDNTIFSSFETIFSSCDKANIPIITSEAGLVSRGALAAFGADIYQWGYDAGKEAAKFLKTNKLPEPVKVSKRQKIFNAVQAKKFGSNPGADFTELKP